MSNTPFQVFVVEDDEWYLKLLEYNLNLIPETSVRAFPDAGSFLSALEDNIPHLVTLDYRLPDMTGDEVFKRIRTLSPETAVIVISEQEDIEVVVKLLKEGAHDYLVKSVDVQDRLLHSVQQLLKQQRMQGELNDLRREVARKYDFQQSIIGHSPAIRKVFELINKSLSTSINVMITGETGTGKELVAKAIHYNSKRKNQTFVPVNVAAIPSELIESELFGHEKGAFTGAVARRIGKFEQAHGGTLFLDEIGEMDLNMQVKLLRVLQEGEVTRVGGTEAVKVDCRILVATHRNLMEEVKEGRFREDLYYRLLGLTIKLPPLRERGNDILLLANKFISDFCEANQLEPRRLSRKAQQKLLAYPFPGNVRELKSRIELAVITGNPPEIEPDDIALGEAGVLSGILTENLSMREYNHRIVQHYLDRHEGNIPKVAEMLDISMSTIYRMLKEMKQEQG